jgi:dihydropteroate synthase
MLSELTKLQLGMRCLILNTAFEVAESIMSISVNLWSDSTGTGHSKHLSADSATSEAPILLLPNRSVVCRSGCCSHAGLESLAYDAECCVKLSYATLCVRQKK